MCYELFLLARQWLSTYTCFMPNNNKDLEALKSLHNQEHIWHPCSGKYTFENLKIFPLPASLKQIYSLFEVIFNHCFGDTVSSKHTRLKEGIFFNLCFNLHHKSKQKKCIVVVHLLTFQFENFNKTRLRSSSPVAICASKEANESLFAPVPFLYCALKLRWYLNNTTHRVIVNLLP